MASTGDIKIENVQPSLLKRWSLINFDEAIVTVGSYKKLNSKSYNDVGKFPVIDQGDKFISGYINDELLLYKGDKPIIIFGDHTRNLKFVDFEFAVGADGTKILRPIQLLNVMFFYYYLKSLQIPSLGYSRHFKILRSVSVPLTPLPEQQRIVAKLDVLFAHLESIKTRLAHVPTLLKNFRQAVLTQAVTGKLTEEWREGKELENVDLLEKIKNKREDLYLKQCETAIKNGKRKPKKPIFSISLVSSLDFEIPSTWVKCHVGDIGEVSNGSTPSRKLPEYWRGNIPWVSSGLVQNCRIVETLEYITALGFENSSVSLLPIGTVLIAMIGEGKTRGQSAILDIEATINQNIAAINIEHGYLKPEYLQYWLKYRYEANRVAGSGTGPKALNGQKVR